MQKILIVGATGCGKTTLGAALAARIGAPLIELDDLFWRPGWQRVGMEEFAAAVEAATRAPAWIATGNYHKVSAFTWARADTVLWLDYPFPLVLWRSLRRAVARACDRRAVCNGNTESWGRLFSRDSILVWLLRSFWDRRRRYGALFADAQAFPHLRKIRLATPRATEDFLTALRR